MFHKKFVANIDFTFSCCFCDGLQYSVPEWVMLFCLAGYVCLNP